MAKTKVPRTYWQANWTGLRLFREDLEEIQSIIESEKYSSNGNQYDTIDELRSDRGDSVQHVEFTAKKNEEWASADFGVSDKYGGSLSVYRDETKFLRLQQFLDGKVKLTGKYPGQVAVGVAVVAALTTSTLAVWFGLPQPESFVATWLVGYCLAMVCLKTFTRSEIWLLRRHEHNASRFWKRNRDTILVSLISTAIGAVLGVVGTRLADSLKVEPSATPKVESPAESKTETTNSTSK